MKDYVKYKVDEELSSLSADDDMWAKILEKSDEVLDERADNLISREYFAKRGRLGSKRSIKTIVKVSIIAATLMVLSVASVMGVEYIQRKYKTIIPRSISGHFNSDSDAVSDMKDVITSQKSGISDKTAGVKDMSDRYNLTWEEYTSTEHAIRAKIILQSKDGSPVLTENENKTPVFTSIGFDKTEVKGENSILNVKEVGNIRIGDKYTEEIIAGEYHFRENGRNITGRGIRVKLTDISDDLSRLELELLYENYDTNLDNENITITLGNLISDYYEFEDMGVKDSIGKVISSGKAETEFLDGGIEDGMYKGYLPKGDNRIVFSDKYPDCYIDNFGFVQSDLHNNTQFAISFVCDEASKNDFKQLAMQSDITGYDVCTKIYEHEDGRIELLYDVNYDESYVNEYYRTKKDKDTDNNIYDTTMEHLEHLYLKKNVNYAGLPYSGYQKDPNLSSTEHSNLIRTHESCVKSEIIPCEYSITFTNKVSSKAFSQDVNVYVPTDTEGREVKLYNITIDDMQVELCSTAELNESDMTRTDNAKIFDEYYIYDGPVFYMSDGSVVETDHENIMSTAHVSMSSIRRYDNEPFLYSKWSYDISGVVNTDNIVKIEWNGVTIWEK